VWSVKFNLAFLSGIQKCVLLVLENFWKFSFDENISINILSSTTRKYLSRKLMVSLISQCEWTIMAYTSCLYHRRLRRSNINKIQPMILFYCDQYEFRGLKNYYLMSLIVAMRDRINQFHILGQKHIKNVTKFLF